MVEQGSIEYLKAFGSRRNRRKAAREMVKLRTRLLKEHDPNALRHNRRYLAKNSIWPKFRFPIVIKDPWADILGATSSVPRITPVISQDAKAPPPRQIELAGDIVATADDEGERLVEDDGSDSAMYGGPPEV